MKTYLTFGLGIAALIILPVLTVQGASGCPDGNTGNNTLVCDITPPQANNDDDQFDGDLGDDILTQAAGVSTVDIDGDGSKTHDYRGGGNGGHDTIYNYGTVTASIAGDWTAGNGGNDTIYNYGYVQNNIMGDEATGAGGNDIIVNYGTVNGTINGEGGNDTVVIMDGSSGGSDNRLLLEGGPGTDALIFRFNTSASAAQVASALAGKSPASGSATIAGKNYTWTNFEEFRNEASGAAATSTPAPTNPPPTATPAPTNPAPTTTTVTYTISTGGNDVNEVDSTFVLSYPQLGIGNAGTPNTYLGLRFVNINIPKGAVINAAQLQFYSTRTQTVGISINIGGELAANSAAFSSSSKPSQRSLTSSRATYASSATWNANAWHTLTDIKTVVQEVVNYPAWQTGAPLTVVIKGTGSGMSYRELNAYEGGAANAIRLVVTYTK